MYSKRLKLPKLHNDLPKIVIQHENKQYQYLSKCSNFFHKFYNNKVCIVAHLIWHNWKKSNSSFNLQKHLIKGFSTMKSMLQLI